MPFIGDFEAGAESIRHGRYDDFLSSGKSFLELTSIEECDACLLPIFYDVIGDQAKFEKSIKGFVEEVERSGKKVLIFVGHDVLEINIPVKNAIIFNSAISKSKQAKNVYPWPHFFEDFLERYKGGELEIRNKGAKPVVGFCGYAPPLNIKMGREKIVAIAKLMANYAGLLQKYPDRISHSYRARAIIGLQKATTIIPNFRLKSNFAFGPNGMNTGNTVESNEDFRKKFVENIIESDYTLCVRGLGNNSVRFFETLCCGRIPVFVNTDSTLPFDNLIDWKSLCVWVEEKDIDRIAEAVVEFHNNISESDFIDLQKKLRAIWEEYLTPTGFFKRLSFFINQESTVRSEASAE
ncbi:hypothetical protein BEN49_14220 [Hymenobacter coccineus]|uniref:Exostosin GT47 domain-containing protein n=2 Tax=Hymenobacter coccineus TaxID=1908235 RepID=A0A1G1SUC1_9BACT|nr:hypothetical protein BEN49_14220 [Hymenobacter coccineus]